LVPKDARIKYIRVVGGHLIVKELFSDTLQIPPFWLKGIAPYIRRGAVSEGPVAGNLCGLSSAAGGHERSSAPKELLKGVFVDAKVYN
jgi:hypothetical protein